jgi:hypothetical protein
MVKKAHILLVLFLSVIVLSSCRKDGLVVGFKAEEFNIEEQIIIGNTLKQAIESPSSKIKVLNKTAYPEAYQYITTLLNTLLFTPTVENRTKFDWNISIIQNDTLTTAFTLPGGHIYIGTGLLKFLGSEHELLGVLAHELYYTDTDLMVQRIKAAFGGVIMGDIILGNEVSNLGSMSEEIPYMDFTDEEVLRADNYALDIMCLFQYSQMGIFDIIERVISNQQDIQWLESRYYDEDIRLENIITRMLECETGNVTNESNYNKFKNEYLP